MKVNTVETWVWVLIDGGMLLACLGLFVYRSEPSLGWVLGSSGGAAVAAGVLLIVVRSRMRP